MRQLIAGNWKMNGLREDAAAIAGPLRSAAGALACDLVICPPATVLQAIAQILLGSPVGVGGQDCHAEPSGAHTGDISAAMLRDVGAGWVILGHSERRADHGETDEQVRQKVVAAQRAGLTPIVCVGETADQRRSGTENETVGWQIEGSLPKDFAGVVAYEPIWSIGTGQVPETRDVAAMHAFIRGELVRQLGESGRVVRTLYGGSVKAANAAALLAIPDVAGALVGGASLDAAAFLQIAGAADRLCNAAGGRQKPRPSLPGNAMTTVLLIVHLFVTLALIGVVLIQRSEGGGLGIGTSQGMGSFMSGRGTANLLTRTTAILAAIFFSLSLTLALLNRGSVGSGRSILDAPPTAAAPGPAPAAGSAQVAPATLPALPAKPNAPAVPAN